MLERLVLIILGIFAVAALVTRRSSTIIKMVVYLILLGLILAFLAFNLTAILNA